MRRPPDWSEVFGHTETESGGSVTPSGLNMHILPFALLSAAMIDDVLLARSHSSAAEQREVSGGGVGVQLQGGDSLLHLLV